MRLEIHVKGLGRALSGLTRFEKLAAKSVEGGVEAAGSMLLDEAQSRVPVDTGELRDSASLLMEGRGFDASAMAGFDAEHGLGVHEDLDAAHDDGEAKFLERPAQEKRVELARAMARKARL